MNITPDNSQGAPSANRSLAPWVFEVRRRTVTKPLDEETSGRWELVTVRGEVDMDTAGQLVDAIGDVAGNAVVDLSGVTFMDSTGIHSLVRAHEALRERGDDLILRNPSPSVRRVLELTSVIDLFTVEE